MIPTQWKYCTRLPFSRSSPFNKTTNIIPHLTRISQATKKFQNCAAYKINQLIVLFLAGEDVFQDVMMGTTLDERACSWKRIVDDPFLSTFSKSWICTLLFSVFASGYTKLASLATLSLTWLEKVFSWKRIFLESGFRNTHESSLIIKSINNCLRVSY